MGQRTRLSSDQRRLVVAVTGVAAMVSLVLAGCGSDADNDVMAGSSTPSSVTDATTAPSGSGAEWTAPPEVFTLGGGWVDAANAGSFLPGGALPSGSEIASFSAPESTATAERGPRRAAVTLYADPDRPDVGLLVGRDAMTDMGPTLPTDAPLAPGSDRLHLDHRGDLTVVTWRQDLSDEGCGCDQEGIVASRGVSDEVTIAAANAAIDSVQNNDRPALAAADVPDGLVEVGTVPIFSPFDDLWPTERVVVTGDLQGHVMFADPDPRLRAMLTFLVSGDQVVPGNDGYSRRVVDVEGATVIVEGAAADVGGLADWAATFAPADDAEVRAYLDDRLDQPFTEAEKEQCALLGDDGTSARFAGRIDDVRWVVGISGDATKADECTSFTVDGATRGGGGGLSGWTLDPLPAVQGGVTGLGDGRQFSTVVGAVSSDTVRVVVTMAGADTEAEIAANGPTEDTRWFGTLIDVSSLGLAPAQGTIVAYAADGSELGRTTWG